MNEPEQLLYSSMNAPDLEDWNMEETPEQLHDPS